MYKVEFLPIAKEDLNDIIYYISHILKNTTAAIKLRDLFMKGFDNILHTPYGGPIYRTTEFLKNEYRSHKVKNFFIFYTINEGEKIVTIVRVLYQKMNIENILE